MAFQTWGTFSVTDHLSARAFVADVLLYDRLVIPVPDDKERERWVAIGRRPEVLDRKLQILEQGKSASKLVTRLNWTEEFRTELDAKYADERKAAREGILDLSAAHAMDRGIVADWVRSDDGRETPEVVPAYTSFAAIRADWAPPTDASDHVSRQADRLVGVIGWEFLVPEDSKLDDDTLLDKAVQLVHRKKFRQARADFHSWRRDATRQHASPEEARRELERLVERYKDETAKVGTRTTILNAFVLVGVGASLAGMLAFPPIGIAAPLLAAAKVGVEWKWPLRADNEARAVAMFHDARKQFGWHNSPCLSGALREE